MKIRIPPQHTQAARAWMGWSVEQRAALSTALRIAPVEDFSASLDAQTPDLDRGDVRKVLRLFMDLLLLPLESRGTSGADVASAFVEALRELDGEAHAPERAAHDWDALLADLGGILQTDSALGVIAKGVSLYRENAAVCFDTRILTDLRPVFTASVGDAPVGLVVIHTLRVHHSGADERVHLSLTPEDLLQLRAAIDRATEKQTALLGVARTAAVPVLSLGAWLE